LAETFAEHQTEQAPHGQIQEYSDRKKWNIMQSK